MKFVPVIKKPSQKVIKNSFITLSLLNLYVISHILFGPNNINSYYVTKNKIKSATQQMNSIVLQNQEYEKEISMLNSATLDYDYLEELVHGQLNYSYKDEKVIVYNKNIE
jgi:cell division protein FtsB